EKVAIVTGDGLVQGAMMISSEPVDSVLLKDSTALMIELLFTAPRNRPMLRKDRSSYYVAVGTELLTWGAWYSREMGWACRILVDGSPDFIQWYERRGLQKLGLDPIVFEGVVYTPMELSEEAAQRLLDEW